MKNIILHLRSFLEKDWFYEIENFYNNINPVYRHSFWILFIITNIVFGFHTVNFLWGNHDWASIIAGKSYNSSFWEGRYGAFVISGFLTGNLYLPIISALWAFAALSMSAVLLAIYWKVPTKTSYFVIFGLILNITPYTLSWLWYAHWTVNIFFGRLLIVVGFIISDKCFKCSIIHKILANLLIILLFNFGLSIYPSYIGTLVIIFAGRIIIDMLDWDVVKKSIIDIFNDYKFCFIDIIIGAITYKAAFEYMKCRKLISNNFYNTQTTALSEIPDKIINLVKGSIEQIIDWSMPFYPSIITKLFLLLIIMFLMQLLLSKRKLLLKLLICATFMVTIFLTKIVALISTVTSITYVARVEFCGYVLLNALIIAISLKLGGILQNVKLLCISIIIYLFAVNDLHQQRTWKLGLEAEKMIWNRVQNRIENYPYQSYNYYIQIGEWKSLRPMFYPLKVNEYMDIDLLKYSFTPRWTPAVTLNYYNYYDIKKTFKYNDFANSEYMSALKRIYDAGLLENAKAWPAQNSIIVYDDIILVIMDEKDLQQAKQLLAEQDKKEKVQKDKINVKAKSAENLRPQAEAK